MLKDISVQWIAGVLIAVSIAALGLIYDPFRSMTIWVVEGIFKWLTAASPISRWWYWTLALTAAVSILCLVLQSIQKKLPHESEFTSFRRLGMVWRWRWYNGHPFDLVALCPSCSRMMRYSLPTRLNRYEPVEFTCQNCTHIQIRHDGDYDEIERQIKIEIEHAVRTESWKTEVPARKTSKQSC